MAPTTSLSVAIDRLLIFPDAFPFLPAFSNLFLRSSSTRWRTLAFVRPRAPERNSSIFTLTLIYLVVLVKGFTSVFWITIWIDPFIAANAFFSFAAFHVINRKISAVCIRRAFTTKGRPAGYKKIKLLVPFTGGRIINRFLVELTFVSISTVFRIAGDELLTVALTGSLDTFPHLNLSPISTACRTVTVIFPRTPRICLNKTVKLN